LPIGTQVPFHCTASGKLYLASLRSDKFNRLLAALTLERHTAHTITDHAALSAEIARTRSRDYATDDEEFMPDMVAIAVPLRDTEGRLLTTLSIHAPKQRHDVDSLVTQMPKLAEAAGRLETLARS